jgi:hypothetical protein
MLGPDNQDRKRLLPKILRVDMWLESDLMDKRGTGRAVKALLHTAGLQYALGSQFLDLHIARTKAAKETSLRKSRITKRKNFLSAKEASTDFRKYNGRRDR